MKRIGRKLKVDTVIIIYGLMPDSINGEALQVVIKDRKMPVH